MVQKLVNSVSSLGIVIFSVMFPVRFFFNPCYFFPDLIFFQTRMKDNLFSLLISLILSSFLRKIELFLERIKFLMNTFNLS